MMRSTKNTPNTVEKVPRRNICVLFLYRYTDLHSDDRNHGKNIENKSPTPRVGRRRFRFTIVTNRIQCIKSCGYLREHVRLLCVADTNARRSNVCQNAGNSAAHAMRGKRVTVTHIRSKLLCLHADDAETHMHHPAPECSTMAVSYSTRTRYL